MAAHGASATFFFLGDVAARFPALARRVAAAGHEVGSHGYTHRHVMQMTRREFRDDVTRSLRVIEDATGTAVHGYRAPYFSIKSDVGWPIEILAELGVRYDASILAIDRPPGLELVCPALAIPSSERFVGGAGGGAADAALLVSAIGQWERPALAAALAVRAHGAAVRARRRPRGVLPASVGA